MASILVTGVAGFIGAAVARSLLDRGDHVIGIDNFEPYYDPQLKRARVDRLHDPRFTFRQVDFADEAALDAALSGLDFGRIVHLGAQAGVRYSIENPRAYIRANVAGHLNILEVARHRNVSHMVYASSSSVYGGNTKMPFSVDDRVDNPVSLYAATKKSDELISESYAHLFRIPLTGLRFFTVYGPWGRPDMAIWLFTDAILSGQAIKVFNHGNMRRDFTYIDDIVAGVVTVLDHPPRDDSVNKAGGSISPHAIYNIGNHRAEALMDVIATIETACNRKAAIDFQPMQAGDVRETFADIDAISAATGYSPQTKIGDGIPAFVNWFRRYHDV